VEIHCRPLRNLASSAVLRGVKPPNKLRILVHLLPASLLRRPFCGVGTREELVLVHLAQSRSEVGPFGRCGGGNPADLHGHARTRASAPDSIGVYPPLRLGCLSRSQRRDQGPDDPEFCDANRVLNLATDSYRSWTSPNLHHTVIGAIHHPTAVEHWVPAERIIADLVI